jgi:hypothetical protein
MPKKCPEDNLFSNVPILTQRISESDLSQSMFITLLVLQYFRKNATRASRFVVRAVILGFSSGIPFWEGTFIDEHATCDLRERMVGSVRTLSRIRKPVG